MGVVSWVVAGAVVGVLAYELLPGRIPGGAPGALLSGMLGAVSAGLLVTVASDRGVGTFAISSFLAAVVGGLILVSLFWLTAGTTDRRLRSSTRR